MTSRPGDVWVIDETRYVNLSRLLRECTHDANGFPVEVVRVRRRVALGHRAVKVLRGRVGQKRHDAGKFDKVVLSGHGAHDRAAGPRVAP